MNALRHICGARAALALFPKHNALHPAYVSIYTPIIDACLRMNRQDMAEHYCLRALSEHPQYLDAYWLLTLLFYRQERYSETLQVGEKAVAVHRQLMNSPRASRLNVPFMYLNAMGFVHLRMGLSWLMLNRFEEALPYLDEAVQSHPRKKDALVEIVATARGSCCPEVVKRYAFQGRAGFPEEKVFAAALDEIEDREACKGLDEQIASSDFWANLGFSLLLAGKHADSKGALQNAVRIDPRSAFARLMLARLRWIEKDGEGLAFELLELQKLLGLPLFDSLSDLGDAVSILKGVDAKLRFEKKTELSRLALELAEEIQGAVEALRDSDAAPARSKG